MIPAKPPGNRCPHNAERESCALRCKYNRFEQGDLAIHSWELKCLDCGYRQTIAYRSDDEAEDQPENPRQCPFCGLAEFPPGIDPCRR
jgi:hypothetical protein